MASFTVTNPSFLFVNYYGEPKKEAKRSLRRVKQHAMLQYLTHASNKSSKPEDNEAKKKRSPNAQVLPCSDSSKQMGTRLVVRAKVPPPGLPPTVFEGYVDPFNSLPAHANGNFDRLLRIHWLDQFADVAWMSKCAEFWKQTAWQTVLECESLYHVLLCEASTKLSHLTGEETGTMYLYHKGRAMQTLRDSLKRESLKRVISFDDLLIFYTRC